MPKHLNRCLSSFFEEDHTDALCLIYLALPFLIFCLTWLRPPLNLLAAGAAGWVLWRALRHLPAQRASRRSFFSLAGVFIFLALWVGLSGIGGYAFQNHDFHYRNALFHDLLSYDWPVMYPPAGEAGQAEMLVYYMGHWLPAALLGKVFGPAAADFFLFLWTWAGVCLAGLQISRSQRWPLFPSALLLVFFSGLDILGQMAVRGVTPQTFWPPVIHLEWWAANFQYTSMTSQLFWVFNQAVPAWVCTALIRNQSDRRLSLFIWSLCFFYAPLPALGLAGILFFDAWREALAQPGSLWRSFWRCGRRFCTLENLAGGLVIAGCSAAYFLINRTPSTVGLLAPDLPTTAMYTVFILLDGGLLWLVLLPERKKDVLWLGIGAMLLLIPWIRMGTSQDFCMRASIPPLFYLMLAAGESLSRPPQKLVGVLVGILLAIGAVTPLFEMGRSIVRTVDYYQFSRSGAVVETTLHSVNDPFEPHTDHPHEILARYLPSIAALTGPLRANFTDPIADTPLASFFFRVP